MTGAGADRSSSRAPGLEASNPLDLTPEEIAQYRLAGLDLNKQVPSIKNFPHAPLPREISDAETTARKLKRKRKRKRTGGGEEQEDGEEEEGQEEGDVQSDGAHHLRSLQNILLRCLDQGDIPRASKAWALMIRSEDATGAPFDIRQNGWWLVGAEILARQGEKGRRRTTRDGYDTSDSESEFEHVPDNAQTAMPDVEARWGSAAGLELVKDYFTGLLVDWSLEEQLAESAAPTRVGPEGGVKAQNVYSAMFNYEIYGVQMNQKEALVKLDTTPATSDDEEEVPSQARDTLWTQREAIRRKTLKAAELIATRMDNLLQGGEFLASAAFLKLRGNLELYIADLSVPVVFGDEEEMEVDDSASEIMKSERSNRLREHEHGLAAQKAGREKAQKFFEKID